MIIIVISSTYPPFFLETLTACERSESFADSGSLTSQYFFTISTTSSLLRASQSPSVARIRNFSDWPRLKVLTSN